MESHSAQGIQQSILNELGDLDLLSAAAEPGWDPAPRRDAVIQIALINSPPRWTTRGYDFAYGNLVDFSVGEPGVMVSVQKSISAHCTPRASPSNNPLA